MQCTEHMLEPIDKRTDIEKMRDGDGPKLFKKIHKPYPVKDQFAKP